LAKAKPLTMHNKTLIGGVCLGGHRDLRSHPAAGAEDPVLDSGLGPGFNLMNSVAVGGRMGVTVPRA